MGQYERNLWRKYSSNKHHSSFYTMGALLLAGLNFLIWLILFLPIYLIYYSSTVESEDVLSLFLRAFVAVNVIGMALTLFGVIKSKRAKKFAILGFLANIMMFGLNFSLLLSM